MANSKITTPWSTVLTARREVSDLNDALPISDYTLRVIMYGFSNTADNRPATSGGSVFAIGNTSYFTQVAISNNSGSAKIHVRNYGASGFTAWQSLIS